MLNAINDLDFTLIEKRKKSSTVLLPEDWAKVIEFFSYLGIAPIKSLKHLFLLTTGQTGWMVLPWSLEGRQEKQKKKVILENLTGKSTLLIGDSITKNIERFAYSQFFPASTMLNVDIVGDTVEAIL